jgi:hypothetical protein
MTKPPIRSYYELILDILRTTPEREKNQLILDLLGDITPRAKYEKLKEKLELK